MACLLRKMNSRVSDLSRDEMDSALTELADQLDARNVKAKIYLVGGAVMVLAFDARFTTGDIDGSVHPTDDVLAVAAGIGERRGLGAEWLNNSAQQFIPVFKEPNWQPILKSREALLAGPPRHQLPRQTVWHHQRCRGVGAV